MGRGRRGLLLGRIMLGVAVVAIVLAVFGFIAFPAYDAMAGPLTVRVLGIQFPGELVTLTIGVLGPVIGLTWMWRIHRAHLEPDRAAVHAYRATPREERDRLIGRTLVVVGALAAVSAWLLIGPAQVGQVVERDVAVEMARHAGPIVLLLGGVAAAVGLRWIRRVTRIADDASTSGRYRELD